MKVTSKKNVHPLTMYMQLMVYTITANTSEARSAETRGNQSQVHCRHRSLGTSTSLYRNNRRIKDHTCYSLTHCDKQLRSLVHGGRQQECLPCPPAHARRGEQESTHAARTQASTQSRRENWTGSAELVLLTSPPGGRTSLAGRRANRPAWVGASTDSAALQILSFNMGAPGGGEGRRGVGTFRAWGRARADGDTGTATGQGVN
jgi:hypothetical protein